METALNIDETIMQRLYAEAKRRGATASALAEAGILHILSEEPSPRESVDPLPKLPKWNSGGELVDISNREELYRVMDEYDGFRSVAADGTALIRPVSSFCRITGRAWQFGTRPPYRGDYA